MAHHAPFFGPKPLWTCRFVFFCNAKGTGWSLEQPQSSRMRIRPRVISILKSTAADSFVTSFCAWTKPWRKNTRIAYGNVGSLARLGRTCGNNRLCAHSGKPHQRLEGPSGKSGTLEAQPYPRERCSSFARLICNFDLGNYINCLDGSSKP